MGSLMQPGQTARKARAELSNELSKIMQRLFWCSLLMMAFGFASSLPAQEKAASEVAADCISRHQLKAIVDSFPHQPATALPQIKTFEQAYCIQAQYVKALGEKLTNEKLAHTGERNGVQNGARQDFSAQNGERESAAADPGKPVGYKVGFTGEAGQKRFAIPHPAVGVILQGMLVKSDSRLPANFAYRGLVEPDVLVTVKSRAIMQATTIEDVALHLDKLYAFLELPSVRLAKDRQVSAKELIALDIGATKMVVGEGIQVEATPTFLSMVQQAQTSFTDQNGKVVQQAPMSNLMGHPFNAVLWLIKQLQQQGKALQSGDYISLGAVGKLFPVSPAQQSYHYSIEFGRGDAIQASIHFNAAD